jgi:hypothetical protein
MHCSKRVQCNFAYTYFSHTFSLIAGCNKALFSTTVNLTVYEFFIFSMGVSSEKGQEDMEKSQAIERERRFSEDKTSEAGDVRSRNDGEDESEEDLEWENLTESDEYWYQEDESSAEDGEKKTFDDYTEEEWMRKCIERVKIRNRSGIIKTLLERRGGRHVETKTLIEASEIVLGGADVMALLLRQNGTRPILEGVVEAVAGWWRNSKMMEVLVDHQSDLPITESVLIAAASGKPRPHNHGKMNDRGKTVLEILLRHRPGIQISEKVVWTAAANWGDTRGYRLIKALLTYGKDVPITEGIVIEAAKNQGRDEVEMLLSHKSISITDGMLEAGNHDGDMSRGVLETILAHRTTESLSEEVMHLAQQRLNGPGLLRKILRYHTPIEWIQYTNT